MSSLRPPWEPVPATSGVWSLEKRESNGWCYRSFAVRLREGGMVVVSPIRGLAATVHDALETAGGPMVALAPNHFHHLGLGEFCDRHRGAVVVASDGARKRVSRQAHRLIDRLDVLSELLPASVSLLEPPGLRTGEVWLRAERTDGSVAWLVGDAFFHVIHAVTGLYGAGLRATGTIPGLRIGSTFLLLAVRDRRSYAAWLRDQIDRDRPTLLVPLHGAALDSLDLADRLRALVTARLS